MAAQKAVNVVMLVLAVMVGSGGGGFGSGGQQWRHSQRVQTQGTVPKMTHGELGYGK